MRTTKTKQGGARKAKKTKAPKTGAKRRIVKTYDYTDEGGKLLYQAVRCKDKNGDKSFFYRQPNPKDPPDLKHRLDPNDPDDRRHWINGLGENTRRVLYRLPMVLDSANIAQGKPIFLVEGEKDADRLHDIGLFVTTNKGGARNWQDEYSDFLTDWQVVILPDNDKAGRDGAERRARSLYAAGCREFKILDLTNIPPGLAEGKDVSDWLDGGGTKRKLTKLAEDIPPWTPDQQAVEPTAKFWPNDEYNAERFVARHGDKVRYNTKWDWLVYDTRRWDRDEGDVLVETLARQTAKSLWAVYENAKLPEQRQQIIKWYIRSQDHGRINSMLMTARSFEGIHERWQLFDRDNYLFNCENGTIDLRTGQCRDHDPADRITRLAPVIYNSQASCELWLKCLDEWMQGDSDNIDYLKRLMGMCLTGDICARTFPIFHGPGRNGKSVFLDTIRGLMGDYAWTAPEDLLAGKTYRPHDTEIASLMGRRLVTLDETKPNMILRTSLVKRMTGDQTLTGRFLYENAFEFHTTSKTILATQNLPRITERTDAIWDRTRLVPWLYRVPDDRQDPYLVDKLKAEWSGILNWLIEGCLRWQKEGGILHAPDAIKTATETYRRESDVLSDFWDENILPDMPRESRVRKSEFRKVLDAWMEQNGYKFRVPDRELNDFMRNRGVRGGQAWIDGKNVKVWYGIGLQTQLS